VISRRFGRRPRLQPLVTLESLSDGGTRVTWRSEFDGKPRGTGWLVRIVMVPYLAFLALQSGRVAVRRAAASRRG